MTLDPGSPQVHHMYVGWCLVPTGRYDRAIEEEAEALRLDPVSHVYNTVLAYAYWWAGDFDRAAAQARQALSLNPYFWLAHTALGLVYEQTERPDEAVAAFKQAIAVSVPTPRTLGMLGHALARAGKEARARAVLDKMDAMAQTQYVSPFDRAIVYAGLDDRDRAFQSLDEAEAEHAFWLIFLRADHRLRCLQDDPRYGALSKKMGF